MDSKPLQSALAMLVGGLMASGCVIYASPSNEAPAKPRPHHQRPGPPPGPPAAPATGPGAHPPPPGARPAGPAHLAPHPKPAPQPVRREDPPKSAGTPLMLRPGVGTGRPSGFTPGAEAAYWIWQGPRGGWRIKTTTSGAAHVFRGRFDAMTGPVSSVDPSRTEFRDRVWKTREGWAFSFKTQGHADGFTFSSGDNGCVVFDLQLDGGPTAKRIFVGRGQLEPGSSYFAVCPKGKQAGVARPRPRPRR